MRSASFSTDRCREMEAAVTGKCSPISPAESLPYFSRFNISRRMGSAKAFKVFCSATAASFLRHLTFNRIVYQMIAPAPSPVKRGQEKTPREAALCRSLRGAGFYVGDSACIQGISVMRRLVQP